MANEPSILDVADEEFAKINKPEQKQEQGSILDIADDEFKKQEEESTQKEFDVAKLEKLKAEGKLLSEVQERMIFDEQDKVPLLEQAGKGIKKFFPAAGVKLGELSRGAYELAREGAVKPVYVGAKYNLGLATPKETNVAARGAEIAYRSAVSGVMSDLEDTAGTIIKGYESGSSFTDKLQGLSADERFKRYRWRETFSGYEQARREETPDRAAAVLSENVLLQKAAGIAAKMQGGTEEDAKEAEKAYSELVLESGLTREELNPYISSLGEVISPISIPGANIATKTIGKYTGKALQKGGELALKGVVKPIATGVEKSAEFVEKGITGVQAGARKLGEYVTGDPDTLIRGGSIAGLISAPQIAGTILAVKPAAIATKEIARTFKDIASAVDVGGTAGIKGLVERGGAKPNAGALTKRLFSAESRGGLGRARAADWMIRQGNAITQQGVNGAVLNTILGLPDIESIEQGFEAAGSGFGVGAFTGSRIMERAGAVIDPRTGLAQKIDTIITPDPSSRRADEDADIKRFLSSVDPDLVPKMEKLGSIDERKKAIQSKVDALEKQKNVTFGPAVQDIKSKISKLKTTIETLDKATPQTQKEILRQVYLAFAEEMDLAKTTGKAAGLNNIQVKILDPSEMEGFFRNSYGATLTDAESVISQLTGNPNLSPQEGESLVNARKVVDRFYNEVGSLQSARGGAISDGSETPAFMRKQNLQGATIVINGDLVKQLSGEGFNVRNVVGHEMQHALSQFSEVRDMLAPIRRELFDQSIVNEDGTINKVTRGIYSDEKLDAYADTYAAAMSPSDNGESFKAQFGDQNKLRAYIKEEVLSEIAGRSGRISGGKRAALDSVGRQVVDWIEVKTQNGVLKTIKETLRKGGIIVDDSGDISTVLGAELTPESLAMIRQYQRQLNNLNQSMVYEGDARKEEVEIPLTKILSDRSLQEKFKNSDIFEKEQVATMTAPDGSKQEILLPPEAGVDPFVGTYRIQGGQLVDEKGIPMNLGPEITFGTMPEGTQVEVGTRIARNVDGSPKILSNREIEARSRNRGKVIRNAIDSALSKGALQLEDTGNGNYRGVMSEAQVNAVLALPNTIVSPNLKRQILFVNEILRRKDGTRMYMEYQAAMRGGKSRALSPQIRDEIPIGFQFAKQGNFLITTMSVSRMHDKMNAWVAKKPENLKLWNGDTANFWSDVIKVLDNHSKGNRGEIGLDADAAIALEKKNAVNDLFNVWNADTKAANPRRTKLPVQKGKDPIDVIVRARRIDRINQYNESALQKMPFNYELNTNNYMPAENPLADFQTPEDFANELPSVTAEEIRSAINTGNLDQLESKLREGDDLKPAESLDEENGNIRIVSMFDPAFMPEESLDFVDVKTQFMQAETNRAKFLSTELEKMYEEGGTDKRIANYESELEGIYQKLESDQESAATEGEENITESEMNPQDVVFDAINNYKTGKVDNQEQTLAEHIRGVFDSEGKFNISPSMTDAEIESAANDIYNQKTAQRQKITGLQFMPAETERYPTSERGMYSGLQKTIDEKVQGKFASPDQLKAIVTNPQNAKAEELKWSGVLGEIDRLAAENQGKVPKDQVMDYLRNEGAVKFEEVTIGGVDRMTAPRSAERLRQVLISNGYNPAEADSVVQAASRKENAYTGRNGGIIDLVQEVISDYRGLEEEQNGITKYAQYQLPGGTNYREVVMTMPVKQNKPPFKQWFEEMNLGSFDDLNENQKNRLFDQYKNEIDPTIPTYTSSHFPDTPNYVAHMRLNERTDAQGNDGLFVEELQSDRHQAGREKGYQDYEKFPTYEVWLRDILNPLEANNPKLAEQNKRFYQQEKQRFESEEIESQLDLIPDAPFRKDWSIQLFKRALRDAVDADKKWIGWTTGDTQAERYDLSKQVDQIAVHQRTDMVTNEKSRSVFIQLPVGDGSFTLGVNNNAIIDNTDASSRDMLGKNLADVVGKEMAQKIMDAKSGTILKGDDLKIGGEGMKGFYDQILPKEIGKYVAKMGGKVEKNKLSQSETFDEYLERVDPPRSSQYELNKAKEEYNKGGAPIWRVDITPEMAGKVRGGQLQFMPENFDAIKNADKSLLPLNEQPENQSISGRLTSRQKIAIDELEQYYKDKTPERIQKLKKDAEESLANRLVNIGIPVSDSKKIASKSFSDIKKMSSGAMQVISGMGMSDLSRMAGTGRPSVETRKGINPSWLTSAFESFETDDALALMKAQQVARQLTKSDQAKVAAGEKVESAKASGVRESTKEQGMSFVIGEKTADQKAFGSSLREDTDAPPRVYASVVEGQKFGSQGNYNLFFEWDKNTPMVITSHHHYGVGNGLTDIHASANIGDKNARSFGDVENEKYDTLPSGKKVLDTYLLVGNDGASDIRTHQLMVSIPSSGIDNVKRAFKSNGVEGAKSEIDKIIATQLVGQPSQGKTQTFTSSEGVPPYVAVQKNRTEAYVLNPNLSNVKKITIASNSQKEIDVIKKNLVKAFENNGSKLPPISVVSKDSEASKNPGRKAITDKFFNATGKIAFMPEQPTEYEPISARIRPLEGISAPTKVVGAKALSLGEIEPPVRGKAMLPDMELKPDISEKSIQSSDKTGLQFMPSESEEKIKKNKDSLKLKMTKKALTDAALSQESWRDWYKEHQEVLEDFFGDYAELFQEILAVTSQASSVKANVGLALKAFGQLMRGEEFDARLRGQEKGGYLDAVIGNLNAIKNKTDVSGRKISNYKAANEGDVTRVVVDRHIARLLFGVDTPSKSQYDLAEKLLTEIANEIGWEPSQVQAALWAHSIVMSGKKPESYGAYLTKLESTKLKKRELASGLTGNQLTKRIGKLADSGAGSIESSKGRGRYSPVSEVEINEVKPTGLQFMPAEGENDPNYDFFFQEEKKKAIAKDKANPMQPSEYNENLFDDWLNTGKKQWQLTFNEFVKSWVDNHEQKLKESGVESTLKAEDLLSSNYLYNNYKNTVREAMDLNFNVPQNVVDEYKNSSKKQPFSGIQFMPESIDSSTSVKNLTDQEYYEDAKYRGSYISGYNIARKLLSKETIDEVNKKIDPKKPAIIIPVLAKEGSNINSIPLGLALVLSSELNIPILRSIVKTSQQHNTNASAEQRAKNVHRWFGKKPEAGTQIILVDDTYTTGQTLKSLADYVGDPAAVVTLSSGRYGKQFDLSIDRENKMLAKAGITRDEFISIYGKQPNETFTGAQAQQYILNGAKGQQGLLSRFPAKRSRGNVQLDEKISDGNRAINPDDYVGLNFTTEDKDNKYAKQMEFAFPKGPKTLTYFSGIGTWEQGLKGEIDPQFAVEYDPAKAAAYRAANGDHMIEGDVTQIDPQQFKGIEYFHASPVCKNYSILKDPSRGGEENDLDIRSADAVNKVLKTCKPKFFTLENVGGYRKSDAYESIKNTLVDLGYKFDDAIYNSHDYGSPTDRKRLLLRATLDGDLPAPIKKQGGNWYDAVSDIIDDLPDAPIKGANFIWRELSKVGIDPENVPYPILIAGGGAFKQVPWRSPDEPAYTFTTNQNNVDRILLPGGISKRVTGRAKARMSGFGDDLVLPENDKLANIVIGNGVPPDLVRNVIGPMFKETTNKKKK